ncbi:hypothetical protein [Pseudomonas sp. dw_358]|uniref:hypothetical protein n=1 Tax=Pseudomonas sp. dw_358 TaxID=2720083 RepID=UPI001BD3B04B|nr:hypothetical protein [Pseudomonas sp. dw_358]
MTRSLLRSTTRRAMPVLLALPLLLLAGCSSGPSGAKCYAEAVPTRGEGGLAWADSLSAVRQKAMNECWTYARRSGGTPGTCRVAMEKCK